MHINDNPEMKYFLNILTCNQCSLQFNRTKEKYKVDHLECKEMQPVVKQKALQTMKSEGLDKVY